MSKRAACSDDEHAPKCVRTDDVNYLAAPSPLTDSGAWDILEQYLTTDMMYPQMEEVFSAYLGNRYIASDWKDARDALFSGDGCDSIALTNLRALRARHILLLSSSSRPDSCLSTTSAQLSHSHKLKSHDRLSRICVQRSRRRPKSNLYVLTEAEDGTEGEEDDDNADGPSAQSPKVVHIIGPSAKDRFTENPSLSSEGRQAHHGDAALSSSVIAPRMYLLHVTRNSTDYIAEQLRRQGFHVTVSIWTAGQLYVVADSPRTITASLPISHTFAVKQYLRISEDEREAVERSCSKLPSPAWVRIKHGNYKGDIGYVLDSDPLNHLIAILIPPRHFPYPMPGRSVALLDRFRLPNGQAVRDVICDGKVIGFSYKGERYYKGLLLKNFHRDHLELVASPHADDIRLHMESGFDTPFVKKTLAAFSLQFMRIGDLARVIAGELRPNVPRAWKRSLMETEGVSKEEVLVSRYYLDRCPLHHILHSSLPTQQHLYSPPESESLQVGDHIEVLAGEHWKKCGIVEWIPTGGTMLWFRDASPVLAGDDVESGVGPFRIQVPVTIVQRTKLPNTLRYTKDKGYDVRPGDVVCIAHGPDYQSKGVVQSVDFPNARLTLLSDSDHSLIDVPITFVIKKSNIIGHEVFIVGGDRKGYRATLHDVASDTCTVAVHGQARTTLRRQDVVTSYGMRLNGAILEGPDLISFCDIRRRSYTTTLQHRSITPPPVRLPSSSSGRSLSSWTSWAADPEGIVDHPLSSVTPSSSTFDPWIVNPEDTQDNIDTRAVSLQDSGPLPWLMSKEFSSTFLFHHAVLKVGAPRFNITISPPKI
ncbi:uncharacterized protein F5891DRAFT_982629 [Suillus fuscotomentosus]|uniref:Chromatin elongation factor SPT5 n=1 Tax=Suillus fuscotomentosus TaxID=1912939 RepID=A0AAD4HIJ1_9AGAM|nr:uncharacterized protein F5891DRAFT_982629 [Suillus fuscotomentosus]KAG1897446.1 hypothetical protein F5891DRAFT_982629 [Suillus fuscotomentosus]